MILMRRTSKFYFRQWNDDLNVKTYRGYLYGFHSVFCFKEACCLVSQYQCIEKQMTIIIAMWPRKYAIRIEPI